MGTSTSSTISIPPSVIRREVGMQGRRIFRKISYKFFCNKKEVNSDFVSMKMDKMGYIYVV